MDRLGDYHTKWRKSDRERQTSYDITYLWNLKYYTKEFICDTEIDSHRRQICCLYIQLSNWVTLLYRRNQHHIVNQVSVQFSLSVISHSLWPHGLQHARPPCPSPTSRAYSNSCPSSQGCHPTISSSVVPFSSCLQSFPASGSFQLSQFFTSGGQSSGVSGLASVLPMNIQNWFPLGLTVWISLLSKGLSRVFPNTTVQKHQSFSARLSL